MTITQDEADSMLLTELEEYESYVENMVTVELNQEQFDALVVWIYNLGPTNFKNSTLLRKLNSGDYSAVPTEIKRWNKAGGKVLEGLVKRREAEALLFEGQAWQN
jgi:lysozyme